MQADIENSCNGINKVFCIDIRSAKSDTEIVKNNKIINKTQSGHGRDNLSDVKESNQDQINTNAEITAKHHTKKEEEEEGKIKRKRERERERRG